MFSFLKVLKVKKSFKSFSKKTISLPKQRPNFFGQNFHRTENFLSLSEGPEKMTTGFCLNFFNTSPKKNRKTQRHTFRRKSVKLFEFQRTLNLEGLTQMSHKAFNLSLSHCFCFGVTTCSRSLRRQQAYNFWIPDHGCIKCWN